MEYGVFLALQQLVRRALGERIETVERQSIEMRDRPVLREVFQQSLGPTDRGRSDDGPVLRDLDDLLPRKAQG